MGMSHRQAIAEACSEWSQARLESINRFGREAMDNRSVCANSDPL